MKPNRIAFSDANITGYIITKTTDDYWNKLIQRVGTEIRNEFIASADLLRAENIVVSMDQTVRNMFGIDQTFIQQQGLNNNIDWT